MDKIQKNAFFPRKPSLTDKIISLLRHHQNLWKYPQYYCRYNVNGFVEELPRLPGNRHAHTCAALPSTKVRLAKLTILHFQAFIVAGGSDTSKPIFSVLTLLPGARSWTTLASLPRRLQSAGASVVGGKMRVTGGWNWSSYKSEVSIRKDPKT